MLLIPSISFAETWCRYKEYKHHVWKQISSWCGWDAEKTERPSDIDYEKGPVSVNDGKYYYDKIEKKEILSTNNNSSSKVSNTNKQEPKAKVIHNEIDKNELKEQLKYWKSLLDDELITQEDYNSKKNELLKISSTTTKTSVNNSNENDKEISNLNNEIQKLKNALSKTSKKNCKKESAGMQYYKDKQCKTLKCKNNQIKNLRAELNNCGGYGKSDEDILYEAVGGAIMSIFD